MRSGQLLNSTNNYTEIQTGPMSYLQFRFYYKVAEPELEPMGILLQLYMIYDKVQYIVLYALAILEGRNYTRTRKISSINSTGK